MEADWRYGDLRFTRTTFFIQWLATDHPSRDRKAEASIGKLLLQIKVNYLSHGLKMKSLRDLLAPLSIGQILQHMKGKTESLLFILRRQHEKLF